MKTSRRHWIPLLAGVILLATGWLFPEHAIIHDGGVSNVAPCLGKSWCLHRTFNRPAIIKLRDATKKPLHVPMRWRTLSMSRSDNPR